MSTFEIKSMFIDKSHVIYRDDSVYKLILSYNDVERSLKPFLPQFTKERNHCEGT